MIYGILIGLIILVPILIAYYYDYKSDPKEFNFSLKTLGKGLLKSILYLLVIGGVNFIYKSVVPFNKNHGIEFNSEREKLGIPKIGDNWENRKYDSDQFTVKWWKSENSDGHFKKIIEYGILNAESETDYYKSDSKKGIYVWSKYDFNKKAFEYFIKKPYNKNVSVTKNGKLKLEKPTTVLKIDKSEFEKYITQ
ncbi:hypothetical protein [uncultured Aquimarina sp.]|uniref:hypothetical protein n=1 Tax=uncultured Aquimarina sp. TaxID=575652 RepID=UPI002602B4E7|nr:hypothetical protein [uncultured Aquimarina sp.]